MPTITLKNVPEELYERLKARALRNRRSLNTEAIRCLESAVKGPARNSEELLERVARFRESLGSLHVTDEDLNKAKNWGRP